MKEKVLSIVNEIREAKDLAAVFELHESDNLRDDLRWSGKHYWRNLRQTGEIRRRLWHCFY